MNYRTVKTNLNTLNKNHFSNTEQFIKFPSRLTYDESGLKLPEQYLMMLFMDRMQSSYQNGYKYFDQQMQQFFVRFTRQQLMDKTGIKSASTISSKLSSLKDKNLVNIKYLPDYVMEIFLPTFVYKDKENDDDSKIENETNLFIFVPRLKIKRGVFENYTWGVQKSNNNHSIKSYIFKSYVINNRTVFKNINSNEDKDKNKNDSQSDNSNELKTTNKKSSNNKNNEKHNNVPNKPSYTTVKGFKESLDNNKFPKESLEDLDKATIQLAYTDIGKANIMQNVVDKVFQAKRDVGKELKIKKDFFWWENNQQLTNDFIKKFYNLINYTFDKRNHVKSYKGYIYKSLVEFFKKIGKRYLGIDQPKNQYSYHEPSKHSKNQNGSNGRKHIKEKLPDWAKPGYKAPKGGVSSKYKSLMKKKLDLLGSNSKNHQEEIKSIDRQLEEEKKKQQQATKNLSNDNKEFKGNNHDDNNKSKKPVDSKRKIELKNKLKNIGNPMTQKQENKQPKVYNRDKNDFKITPEMITNANNRFGNNNNSNEISNDTSKNDKNPNDALSALGFE